MFDLLRKDERRRQRPAGTAPRVAEQCLQRIWRPFPRSRASHADQTEESQRVSPERDGSTPTEVLLTPWGSERATGIKSGQRMMLCTLGILEQGVGVQPVGGVEACAENRISW